MLQIDEGDNDDPNQARADIAAMASTLGALEIIISAPPWPRRGDLSESGQALHDKIVDTAKPFSRAIAEERFDAALQIAATWTEVLNAFLDQTRVVGHEPSERLIRVYRYYMDQIADFFAIHGASRAAD